MEAEIRKVIEEVLGRSGVECDEDMVSVLEDQLAFCHELNNHDMPASLVELADNLATSASTYREFTSQAASEMVNNLCAIADSCREFVNTFGAAKL